MSPADRIAQAAAVLVAQAEALGVTLRISHQPLQPPAMGHIRHVVEAWPARHGPKPPTEPESEA